MGRRTLVREVHAEGNALHSGLPVVLTLAPAPPGSGIVFRRADLGDRAVAATYDRVTETRLGTVIADQDISVGVIEHLMAALSGAEIDDAKITVDGPEPPILDGDALSYLRLIREAGINETELPREGIRVLKRIEVRQGSASASFEPASERLFNFEIEFESQVIGCQRLQWSFSPGAFGREIAPARTFGFIREFEALKEAGLARGASLENTLAIDGNRLLNPHLLRFSDEFVRHKILDAIGDLALAGAPIFGWFRGVRSGHALNNRLLRALFADDSSWVRVALG